jgi:hypothetical protein
MLPGTGQAAVAETMGREDGLGGGSNSGERGRTGRWEHKQQQGARVGGPSGCGSAGRTVAARTGHAAVSPMADHTAAAGGAREGKVEPCGRAGKIAGSSSDSSVGGTGNGGDAGHAVAATRTDYAKPWAGSSANFTFLGTGSVG